MAEFPDTTYDNEVAVQESQPKLKRPPRYKVILLNDDYTPMDFVVEVLKIFFGMTQKHAIRVMLQVHEQGKGNCGTFTRDVAETKVTLVSDYARENKHPLLCRMEKA